MSSRIVALRAQRAHKINAHQSFLKSRLARRLNSELVLHIIAVVQVREEGQHAIRTLFARAGARQRPAEESAQLTPQLFRRRGEQVEQQEPLWWHRRCYDAQPERKGHRRLRTVGGGRVMVRTCECARVTCTRACSAEREPIGAWIPSSGKRGAVSVGCRVRRDCAHFCGSRDVRITRAFGKAASSGKRSSMAGVSSSASVARLSRWGVPTSRH